jgi:uncharacterized protein YkwD
MKQPFISRRSFLETATASALWPICQSAFGTDFEPLNVERKFDDLCANLLELVNEERAVEKLLPLEMDDFAAGVATAHAEDMAQGEFASHWGRNGLKPYQRLLIRRRLSRYRGKRFRCG